MRYRHAWLSLPFLNAIRSAPVLPAEERTSISRICRLGRQLNRERSMDVLAGMLAYVAGIGALFAALAVSFFVFFATPHESLQTETQPQNVRAMLVRPSAPNKPTAEARVKQNATQSAGHSEKVAERHAAAAVPRSLHRRPHPPEIPSANAPQPRLKRGGSSKKSAPAAGPTSRTQALRAGFSVTPIEFRRNLQA
jgi:hypothetical protein